MEMMRTKELLQKTNYSLSEYQLRKGYKEGWLPAVRVGTGKGAVLLWNPEAVEEALKRRMNENLTVLQK